MFFTDLSNFLIFSLILGTVILGLLKINVCKQFYIENKGLCWYFLVFMFLTFFDLLFKNIFVSYFFNEAFEPKFNNYFLGFWALLLNIFANYVFEKNSSFYSSFISFITIFCLSVLMINFPDFKVPLWRYLINFYIIYTAAQIGKKTYLST